MRLDEADEFRNGGDMNSDQLKAWRSANKLSQGDLASKLNISRDAVSNYERGVQPVPKTVELATAALSIGIEEFDGSPIRLDQFKVMSNYGVEWIESFTGGWRSAPQAMGTIAEWFRSQGITIGEDGLVSTTRTDVAMMITMRWR
ncbi:helix-turn-helix domain-containing protein [Bosea sp. TAF32]|uniref:helix-turn-helix domain-containing protein n=1 Tax=Bosea sp. TAF32 TaxID=3237482 RepID=UPI003F8DCF58